MERHAYVGQPVGGPQVGDITFAAALPNSQYEDAKTAPAAARLVVDYPVLSRTTGKPTGRSLLASTVARTVITCVNWNGVVYGAVNGGYLQKRTGFNGAWVATSYNFTTYGRGLPGFFAWNHGPNAYLSRPWMWNNDGVNNGFINGINITTDLPEGENGVGNVVTNPINDVAEGGGYVIICQVGLIRRAPIPAVGASPTLTTITTNLSTKTWIKAFYIGTTFFLLAADGSYATSADAGATWTLNAAASGAGTIVSPGAGNVVYDPAAAKFYAICTDNAVRTCSTLGGGWTTEATLDAPTGVYRLAVTAYGLVIWAWNKLYTLKRGASVYALQTSTFQGGIGAGSNVLGVFSPPKDWGDGYLAFESDADTSAQAYKIADQVSSFDRVTIADPLLPGLSPYIKVK